MTETSLHSEIFIQHIVWGLQYMLVPILYLQCRGVTICAVKMSRGDRIDGIISLFGGSKCRVRVVWPTEPSGNQSNLWYYFLIWKIQVPNPSDSDTSYKLVRLDSAFPSGQPDGLASGPNCKGSSILYKTESDAIQFDWHVRMGPTHAPQFFKG